MDARLKYELTWEHHDPKRVPATEGDLYFDDRIIVNTVTFDTREELASFTNFLEASHQALEWIEAMARHNEGLGKTELEGHKAMVATLIKAGMRNNAT